MPQIAESYRNGTLSLQFSIFPELALFYINLLFTHSHLNAEYLLFQDA
ncbi:MAG: hypothetical protein JW776_16775 [Candidatus Lokiarchaeota archaeon]|nr:hypothetical protein [Candidatus Lokiarchaeota archaeon]